MCSFLAKLDPTLEQQGRVVVIFIDAQVRVDIRIKRMPCHMTRVGVLLLILVQVSFVALFQGLSHALKERDQDGALVAEVIVNQARCERRRLGDALDGRAMITLRGHDVH